MIIEKRKWLLIVSITAIVSFLITLFYISIFSSETFYQNINNSAMPNATDMRGPLPQFGEHPRLPFYVLPLSSVLLVVAIIPMSYYFISLRFEKSLEKKFDVISKLMEKNSSVSNMTTKKRDHKKDDKNIVLKFLNPGERKVVETLIEKKGEVLQSDITRMEGMTKLKTHRAVRDLERKGIIKREAHGKTHRIILSKEIKEAILK